MASLSGRINDYYYQFKTIIQIASFLITHVRLTKTQKLALRASLLTSAYLLVNWIIKKSSYYSTDYPRVAKKIGTSDKEVEYDVIIVGGGTSGCALAARLSEIPSLKVLLLEAGGSSKTELLSRIPAAYPLLFYGSRVHQYYTATQTQAGNVKKFWPRAKMLGGCSTINALIAQYGAPDDFEEWAKITGDKSWGWEEFSKSFRKFENYGFDARYPDTDHLQRGGKGPVTVGYFSQLSDGCKAFINASTKVGIPFSTDFNTTMGTAGVNRLMTYVDKSGTRVTTESAYLTRKVLARKNLTVVTYAHVTKILTVQKNGVTKTVGVEFQHKKTGPRFRARAKREVVISAGAIQTPQILMVSGIGPADHLKEFGIKVVLDNPSIGQNLLDHPVVDLNFHDGQNASNKFIKPGTFGDWFVAGKNILRYFTIGGGPYSSNLAESACFIRTDDSALFPADTYPKKIEDSTSGPGGPDIEILSFSLAYKKHGTIITPHLHTFSLHIVLLRPTTTGFVKLASADPWAAPIMDPRYAETQHDADVLVRGVKKALEISRTEPMASYLDHTNTSPELDHQLHLKSDADLEKIVRARMETLYHPAGTARMGPKDKGGVVDTRLRVYGIPNLRICDASIMPKIVSGHTAGVCIAAAEKLADMMKADFGFKV